MASRAKTAIGGSTMNDKTNSQRPRHFEWEDGFRDRSRILKTIGDARKIGASGSAEFSGAELTYWEPVLNSAVRANKKVGTLAVKAICIRDAIKNSSVSLKEPDQFLNACDDAFIALEKQPKTEFVAYSSLTYTGDSPLDEIEVEGIKITWLSHKSKSEFLTNANNARKELADIIAARNIKQVSDLAILLAHVPARNFADAQELAVNSFDRLRGLVNLMANSSRGVNPFHAFATPHAMNRFRAGPYQTIHKPDGSLAAKTVWYEPGWWHDVNPRLEDPRDYGQKIQLYWSRVQENPLKTHILDGLMRYCRALDVHDFVPSLIAMWSTLETLTGSRDGSEVVDRIRKLFKDHDDARMVANHLRIRRNENVHSAITPRATEHDTILVQLNLLVSQILFFCINEGNNFKCPDELFTLFKFSNDKAALKRQRELMAFFASYKDR
jgi:hypothetical protein